MRDPLGIVTVSGPVVEDVERIAVLRANGLGDYVFALPALDALRGTYPGAEIVLLGSPWHAHLAGRPGPVDRVEVVPPSPGIREGDADPYGIGASERFLARMREERFDIALQMHGGGRNSNPIVLGLGARVTAGLRTPDAPELDRWLPYRYFQHEWVRYLEIAALVGAMPVSLAPQWRVSDAEREHSRAILAENGRDERRPLAVLHPGATDGRRRWPLERFSALADALAREGAQVALVSGAEGDPLVHEVAEGARAHALDLSGLLSVPQLAAALESARLLVSNDSGPLHLARAVGTPTVGLYWVGNLVNAGPLVSATHRVGISWRTACPRCGADCMAGGCEHQDSFVADIAYAQVELEALDLLAHGSGWRGL